MPGLRRDQGRLRDDRGRRLRVAAASVWAGPAGALAEDAATLPSGATPRPRIGEIPDTVFATGRPGCHFVAPIASCRVHAGVLAWKRWTFGEMRTCANSCRLMIAGSTTSHRVRWCRCAPVSPVCATRTVCFTGYPRTRWKTWRHRPCGRPAGPWCRH